MDYQVVNEWPGGFQGEVVITNLSATPINGWRLAWSFSAGQQITQLWSGDWDQNGPDVTVDNVSYNPGIAANGGTVGFGFLANGQGTNPPPTAFTLNGTSCAVS